MTTRNRVKSPRLARPWLRLWAWTMGAIAFFSPWALLGLSPKPATASSAAPSPEAKPKNVIHRVIRTVVIRRPPPIHLAPTVQYVSGGSSSGSSYSGGGSYSSGSSYSGGGGGGGSSSTSSSTSGGSTGGGSTGAAARLPRPGARDDSWGCSMITWNVLRAAGIGSYLMLFVSVAWGLVGTTSPTANRPTKQSSISIHQFASPVGLVLLAVHMGGLIVDRYMKFDVLDVLIPLRGSYKPVGVALGIAAMYAMVFVVVLSWIRKGLPTGFWRATHILAVPAFTLAMLHGVFAGTDTVRPVMWGLYLSTGLIVTFLLVVRGLTAGLRRRAAFAARNQTSGSIIPAPSMLSDGKRTTGSVV